MNIHVEENRSEIRVWVEMGFWFGLMLLVGLVAILTSKTPIGAFAIMLMLVLGTKACLVPCSPGRRTLESILPPWQWAVGLGGCSALLYFSNWLP